MTLSLPHRLVFALAATAAIASCAAPDADAQRWTTELRADGWRPGVEVRAISDFQIDGFKVLDNSHVVIFSGAARRHLITFGSPCPGLLFAQRLGYRALSGSLGRLDRLIVFGPGTRNECVIDSIHALELIGG